MKINEKEDLGEWRGVQFKIVQTASKSKDLHKNMKIILALDHGESYPLIITSRYTKNNITTIKAKRDFLL